MHIQLSRKGVKNKRKLCIWKRGTVLPFSSLKFQVLFLLVLLVMHPLELLVVMATVQRKVNCILWLMEINSVTHV
jgi:hypothetical protein